MTTRSIGNESGYLRRIAARNSGVLLLMMTLGVAVQAAGPVSISGSGTPSYSQAIAVPPGIAGMAPNIGLLYSGSSISGPVGLGWTLQGISMITRCPGSKLIDGYSRRVDYSGDDKLCLDGQRLIQTSDAGVVVNGNVANPGLSNPFQQGDSLGGSGSGTVREYRTAKDMYARIRAYGAAGGNPANGPAYFKVWTKSGQIYEYGVNSNATSNATITASGTQVAVAWSVSRISDTVGNYIDFQYEQRDVAWGSGGAANTPTAGHEWNLTEIRYTGNASQLPVNRVVFGYEDRSDTPNAAQDRAEAYHQGSKTVSVRRLTSVRTYVNWPADQATPVGGQPPSSAVPVKTIKLTYEKGPVTQRSRLVAIVECAGKSDTTCLPPTVFNYAPGGGVSFTASSTFKSGPLATLPLTSTTGQYGTLVGNFLGSGRTDVLRWGDDASQNVLYKSVGDGGFTNIPSTNAGGAFNLVGQRLFSVDGCYSAIAADFDGDGLADILRIMQPTSTSNASCGTVKNILFKSNGDGSFTAIDLTSTGIDFTQVKSVSSSIMCPDSKYCTGGDGIETKHTTGKNYHVLDVNGDGVLDIITTLIPSEGYTDTPMSDADLCSGMVCTHVYLGRSSGGFDEVPTNLTHRSMYSDPPGRSVFKNYLLTRPYVGDINGDGFSDLLVDSGNWVSRGDGNFDPSPNSGSAASCAYPLDYNGDGRSDCVGPYSTAAYQTLWVADGTSSSKVASTTNLTSTGFELVDTTANKMGIVIADFDGDGRSDILRWKDDPTQNTIFLSNGDSTFRTGSFNLTTTNDQLQKSDNSAAIVLGDFSGRGTTEILRLVANPSTTSDATRNALYVKNDTFPADQLVSVTLPSKLTTTLTWVPLTNANVGSFGSRYTSDRGTSNAASYPVTDLTIPMYVVATSTSDTGTGSRISTEYSYAGLKAAYDGRGWLGFRESRQQHVAPSGDYLTVITRNLQTDPFIGVAATTETRLGALDSVNASLISQTTNIYCDTTASAGAETSATAATPCSSTSKLQRPYLYQSQEKGWDLNGVALPVVTTTNTFNSDGDPSKIVVQTVGTAVGGLAQTATKTTINQYQTDSTAGESWILSRLTQSTVQNTVQNDIGQIATSAGSAPNASSVGTIVTPPAQTSPVNTPMLMTIIMQLLDDDTN